MTFILVPILIIGTILFFAKMMMQKIKEDDRKKGLKIDDKEYTIRKTIGRPKKQEDRIEKMIESMKPTFADYMVNVISEDDDDKVPKCILIFAAGILYAVIFHASIATFIIFTLLSIWLYRASKMRILICMDLFFLINFFCIGSKLLTYVVITPIIVYLNYYYFAEYCKFKEKIKNQI